MAESSNKNKQAAEIDAIRNIIFGQQIQDYESRFEEMQKRVENEGGDLRKELGSFKKEIMEELASLKKSIDKVVSSSHAKTLEELEKLKSQKADKSEVGKILVELGKKLMEE